MAFLCGLCGKGLPSQPSGADLTREEVASLFTISTKLNGGRLIVHGLFARADTKNTNGRIYPKAILKREVRRFQAQHIKRGIALGELNHPSYYSAYFRSLNLPNISHQVLDVAWRGNELWGTIEVLPTPAGLLLWELYSRGIKLGVSSRGWASVVADPANDRVLVDSDFQLITFDFVTEPSNAGAYLVPINAKYRKPLPEQSRAVRASYLGFGSSDMALLDQLPSASSLAKWLKLTRRAMAAQMTAGATAAAQPACDFPAGVEAPTLKQPAAAAVACSVLPGSSNDDEALTDSNACGSAAAAGSVDAGSSMLRALVPQPAAVQVPGNTPLGGGVVAGCHYHVLQESWLPRDPAGRDFKVHLSLVATKAHLLQQKQQQPKRSSRGHRSSKAQHEVVAQAAAVQQVPQEDAGSVGSCQDAQMQQLEQQEAPKQQQELLPQEQQQQQQSLSTPQQGQQHIEQEQEGQQKQQQRQQQQQGLDHLRHLSSAGADVLCTTSTGVSTCSMGSAHLAIAREMLLCSSATDMSGCSLGPVMPLVQQQQQVVQDRQQHQVPQRLVSPTPTSQPTELAPAALTGLSLPAWQWDVQQQMQTAARPSALRTVPVPAVPGAASSSNSSNSSLSLPEPVVVAASAAVSAQASAAAPAAPIEPLQGVVVPGACQVDVEVQSQPRKGCIHTTAGAAGSDHDTAQHREGKGACDNCSSSSGKIAAWYDADAQQVPGQQQEHKQEQHQEHTQREPLSSEGEYIEIKDVLHAYQNQYRLQRFIVKHEVEGNV